MPAKSKAQQKFMGAELARKRAGEETVTDMSEEQLEDFAATSHEDLPEHKEDEEQKFEDSDESSGEKKAPRKRSTRAKSTGRKASSKSLFPNARSRTCKKLSPKDWFLRPTPNSWRVEEEWSNPKLPIPVDST